MLAGIAQGAAAELVGEAGAGVSAVLDHACSQLRRLGVRVVKLGAREHRDEAVGVLRAVLDDLGRVPGRGE